MMTLLRRLHQDIKTDSAGLPRKKSARENSISGIVWKHEQYAIGHYQQEWAFAAKLFESYRVGIVNLGLFSLKRTLHQIPNPLRRLLAFMYDPVHLLDNGHLNA
jgi:hypothetical protein